MATPSDYKNFAVLYVDDEEKSLKYFRLLCGDRFRVLTARNGREGLNLFQQHQNELGLLLADQCMPGETGIWLLERAREMRPDVPRLLLSDGCDWDNTIAALQSGLARRIIRIPWEPAELEPTVRAELEVFMLQRERDQLLKDSHTMLADRITSLKILSAGLNSQLRELLQAPRIFVERVPTNLEAKGVNITDLPDLAFWRDLYGQAKAQFIRIDEVLNVLRMVCEESPLGFDERVKLHDVIQTELTHLKTDLQANELTVEDFVPEDLPEINGIGDRLQRLFELLLRYKMARLTRQAKVRIAARLLKDENQGPDEIEITVADNGQGWPLPPDQSAALNGTLSNILVHQQGGSLDIRREEGKGTTFLIRLPVSRAGVAPKKAA